MKSADYKLLREKIGTQQHVAGLLGVSLATVAHREQDVYPIKREAALALERLLDREKAQPTAKFTRLKPQYGPRKRKDRK